MTSTLQAPEPAPSALELARSLGLFDRITHQPLLDEAKVARFEERSLAFDWINMATADLPLGDLVATLAAAPALAPPRTGHLGNWSEILRGRAGTLDYNRVLTEARRWSVPPSERRPEGLEAHGALGRAAIYDINQTETADLSDGDWVYLPGSVVEAGRRRLLPLETWNGRAFEERGREGALFTPFVRTRGADGEPVPLVTFHDQRLARTAGPGYRFSRQSSWIIDHREVVVPVVAQLLEAARNDRRPDKALARVVHRVVGLDGRVRGAPCEADGAGFRLGELSYPSAEALARQALLPFEAASDPEGFFARMGEHPEALPLLSSELLLTLDALLALHYPDGGIGRSQVEPVNVHLHWGALGMAGYPPRHRGYFAAKSGDFRKLTQEIVGAFPEHPPVLFAVLPAAPFALLPTDAHPGDLPLVEELLERVLALEASWGPEMHPQVEAVVESWWQRARREISPYFAHRFSSRRDLLDEGLMPASSSAVVPEGFYRLTLRRASMVVGGLKRVVD